ncbi:MAG: SPOR domain-containing protein [Chitinophagales bacterium]
MKQLNIIEHLQEVLFLYSTVILPNIGEFSKEEISANINEYDNVIAPPKKTLHFNSKNTHNDFILVKHIAKKEQISEAKAQNHIDDYVKELQEELAVGHTINLLNVGDLSKDSQGNLSFVPNEEANYSFDTFGLPPVELPEIKADRGLEVPAAKTVVGAGKGLHTTIEKKEVVAAQNELKNTWVGADTDEDATESNETNDGTIAAILAAKAEKNAAKMPLPNPLPPTNKKKKTGFWMWLLPIMILCLFFFLLLQLSSSDKAWWEHKPFSYFSKDKTETIADNNSANGNNTDNANGSNSSNSSGNASSSNENGSNNTTGNNGNASTNNASQTNGNAGNNGENGNKSATKNTNTASDSGADKAATNSDAAAKANDNKNASKNSTSNTNKPADTANKNTTTTTASSAELSKIKVNEPKANEYLATNSPKGYYVIIGAFKGDTNANKKINDLKKQGFTAHSLPTKSGWNRVGIYNTDINKAKNQLLASKKKHNKGSWLLHFK